jgi:hypothetical protein
MRISKSMINYYLDTITVAYFNDHDMPPDDIRGYDELVETMRLKAIKHGDMDHLRVALAFLLTDRRIDLEAFNGGRYPYDAAEMREIIRHTYEILFPGDKGPPEDVLGEVELVDVPLEAWWQERLARQGAR